MEAFTQKMGNNRLFLSVPRHIIAKSLSVLLLIAILRTINARRMQNYTARTQIFINDDIQKKLINAAANFNLLKRTTTPFSHGHIPVRADPGIFNQDQHCKTAGNTFPEVCYKYVKGSIVNELGMPVANAMVTIKETGIATNTGYNGEFVLTEVSRCFTLIISCTGYETLVFNPDTSSRISICLRYSNRRVMANLNRITIYTKSAPLILLNDHPLFRDIDDLKPEEVESITMLNQAKAAAITSRRAANGVISITTKTGNYF